MFFFFTTNLLSCFCASILKSPSRHIFLNWWLFSQFETEVSPASVMCRLAETFGLEGETCSSSERASCSGFQALFQTPVIRNDFATGPLSRTQRGTLCSCGNTLPWVGNRSPGAGFPTLGFKTLWKTGWDSLSLVEVGVCLWLLQGVRDDPDTLQTRAYSYDWQLICSLLGSSFESQSLWETSRGSVAILLLLFPLLLIYIWTVICF